MYSPFTRHARSATGALRRRPLPRVRSLVVQLVGYSLAPESVFASIMVYRGGWGGAPTACAGMPTRVGAVMSGVIPARGRASTARGST
jgi:hypothetical protein